MSWESPPGRVWLVRYRRADVPRVGVQKFFGTLDAAEDELRALHRESDARLRDVEVWALAPVDGAETDLWSEWRWVQHVWDPPSPGEVR